MANSKPSPHGLCCNLCWKELKPPFLVTSCNHAFCLEHQNDERVKQSTCPGCGHHLAKQGGLTAARFKIEPEESGSLRGLQPEDILLLTSNAIKFWVSQERTMAAYHQHQANVQRTKRDEQKEQFHQAHAELTQEINALRQDKEVAEARNEELKREMHVLEEKYQEETHKVRTLQERVIGMKRKRGDMDSPMHMGSTTPERAPQPMPVNPVTSVHRHASPMHLGSGGPSSTSHTSLGGPPRNLSRLSSPAPHRSSYTPSAGLGGLGGLGSSASSLNGVGGGLGSLSRGGGGSSGLGIRSTQRLGLGGHFGQASTPIGSRQSTPLHRSSSFHAMPSPARLGGSGGFPWSSGKR